MLSLLHKVEATASKIEQAIQADSQVLATTQPGHEHIKPTTDPAPTHPQRTEEHRHMLDDAYNM